MIFVFLSLLFPKRTPDVKTKNNKKRRVTQRTNRQKRDEFSLEVESNVVFADDQLDVETN